MTLAAMIAEDEDALICDFAETYHIHDYKAIPISLAATLSSGLGEKSRIKKKISKNDSDASTLLLASVADGVRLIAWMLSEDGKNGVNRPKSIYGAITGMNEEKNNDDAIVFQSPEDFEQARKKIIEGAVK